METLLGIDLGGTKIAVAAVQGGQIIERHTVATPETGFKDVAQAMIEAAQAVIVKVGHVDGIGVGAPGPLDFKTGTIKFAPNIYGLENAPIVATLSQAFGVRVELENDANAAGLAEHVLGAAKEADSSMFITVSTGIGGGLIFNDRVWRGAHGIAGEIGHVVSLAHGPVAGSNIDGALEAVASGSAIERDATFAYNRAVSTREAFQLAQAGDPKALRIVNNAARHIGLAIADVQKTYDPAMFVLGGGVSAVGDFFLDKVRAVASEYARAFAEPTIRQAVLGSDAGVIGAALSARQ